ncbi:DUF4247 domain-containing protein [Virgibacillus phasianinus]|uniref:DUF4247 domain-containing protein n=2 Tax=Virgibacillus phasianinus TaxID=2017483 RepID=A0A220U8P0_9BACI|nr:DUF4247 domain-containing protein [Virgibacillus phasianinus]
MCLLFIMFIAAGCSSPFSSDRGIPEEVHITADNIPEEPSKAEIIDKIKNNSSNEIDDIIEANFSLMDVVSVDSNKAEIYATRRFELSELSSVLSDTIEPEKVSEVIDNQQILVYPDYFVTLKISPDDNDALIIEVAGDEFVRRNYAPSFLQTYFAYRLLDSFLGVNDWGRRRSRECGSGNCYGGYTGKGYYPNGTPSRGNTSFRGGGPGAGK